MWYTHNTYSTLMNPAQTTPAWPNSWPSEGWSAWWLGVSSYFAHFLKELWRFCVTPAFPSLDVNFASFENILGLTQKFVKCQLENFNWLISNISSLNDLLVLLITYHQLLLPSGWQLLIYSFLVDDIICPWMELTKALHI